MPSRSSSLSLLALLLYISTIAASPIHNSLGRRASKVLIGYRYVSAEKAAEYNSYGTLTAVGASGRQLGEGAYLSPNINEYNVASTYWQCLILADESKFNSVQKLYIPQSSNAWFSSRRLRSFITNAGLDPERTVLFAKIDGDPDQHVQMLIPPYFLRRSPRFHGDYGRGDLGIEVICVPKSEQSTNYFGIANWGAEWRIPGWACDFFRKRDGTDSCPLQPSPVGPIIVPDTFIPAPSSDISTVSSYSFTETPVTATSTALPSGISYFPSGFSSALPPPVSGVSTGSIVFVSSSFSLPAPIPTNSSASGSASSSSRSASAVSSASGHSSVVTSSSAGASSAKSSASSHPASSSSSKPTSKSASSVHSSATSASAKSSAGKSSTVRTTSSAKPTTTKATTTKATTTKAATTPKPKPKGGH
ncbi:hypothetical protein C8R44DRAFT_749492 [Mycena epipterygia]|nr:hypothetical protein C8R44DRAFT_749492 [Mycena epipterygia]